MVSAAGLDISAGLERLYEAATPLQWIQIWMLDEILVENYYNLLYNMPLVKRRYGL